MGMGFEKCKQDQTRALQGEELGLWSSRYAERAVAEKEIYLLKGDYVTNRPLQHPLPYPAPDIRQSNTYAAPGKVGWWLRRAAILQRIILR